MCSKVQCLRVAPPELALCLPTPTPPPQARLRGLDLSQQVCHYRTSVLSNNCMTYIRIIQQQDDSAQQSQDQQYKQQR